MLGHVFKYILINNIYDKIIKTNFENYLRKFYFYTLFDTTIQFYHQFRDIFINIIFNNEQKIIVPLPYLLLNHRLFLSLFEIHLILDLPSRSPVSVQIRRLRRDPPFLSRSAVSIEIRHLSLTQPATKTDQRESRFKAFKC